MSPRTWWRALGAMLRPYLAQDSFRDGGDLVDVDGLTAGRDKVVHFVCAGMLWLVMWGFEPLARLAGFNVTLGGRVVALLVATIGWEVFELVRYVRWNQRGRPQPWPWATDQFSWRDVVAGLAGAIASQVPIQLWTWFGIR